MSAREFIDTYQYVVIGYRMQGKHARYEARHLEATGAQAACQKVHAEGLEVVAAIRGTNMMSPVLCSVIHEPSPQPHVAAGSGFKERMRSFFSRLWCQEFGLHEAEEKFDALLAEVVEIDVDSLANACEYFSSMCHCKRSDDRFGLIQWGKQKKIMEQFIAAAALIRAATQSPAKPPQA